MQAMLTEGDIFQKEMHWIVDFQKTEVEGYISTRYQVCCSMCSNVRIKDAILHISTNLKFIESFNKIVFGSFYIITFSK